MTDELYDLIKDVEECYSIQNIKETDKAYFAGLFDGEGYVGIKKSKCKNRTGYQLRAMMVITYKPILLKIQKLFGGNIRTENMEKRKNCISSKKLISGTNCNPDKWKQQYSWEISSGDALCFLKVIEPFCKEKKEQVSLSVIYEQNKKHDYIRSKEETERSEFFYQELKKLKKEKYYEYEGELNDKERKTKK